MKKTIIYHEINQHEIPCLVEEMRLYDVKPFMDEKGAFECSYRSVSTYELAESIAQKRNAIALEEIKPLTIGYTGRNSDLIEWGGEKYKSPFIDTYKNPEANKRPNQHIIDLGKVTVKKNVSQEEVNERALWCHIMEKLAPNETRSVDELCESYKKKENASSLTCFIKPKKKRTVKGIDFRSSPRKAKEGKYKYVSLVKPGKWRVQASFKGVSYKRGYYSDYNEACAAADILIAEINERWMNEKSI